MDTNEEARNKRVRIWEEVSRRRGSGAGKRGKGDDGRNHWGGPEEIRAWDGGNNGRVAVYTSGGTSPSKWRWDTESQHERRWRRSEGCREWVDGSTWYCEGREASKEN